MKFVGSIFNLRNIFFFFFFFLENICLSMNGFSIPSPLAAQPFYHFMHEPKRSNVYQGFEKKISMELFLFGKI